MKKLYLFLTLILTFSINYSQSVYTFEIDNVTYQNLQNNTILVQGNWDDPLLNIPLGFDFQLGTFSFNSIYITDWSVGGIVSSSPNDFGTIPIFMLIDQDIISRGVSNSPISYVTEGAVGSRILKLEWNNFGFIDDSTLNDYMNMQLWLYEGSNIIEYHYGPNAINNPSESFEGFSGPLVGLITSYDMTNDLIADESYLLSDMPSNPTINTYHQGDVGTAIPLTGSIPSGTIYRFIPQNTNSISGIEKFDFSIYPNPSSKTITLTNLTNPSIKSILIYNSLGEVVKEVPNNSLEINVSDLSNGIYLLQIKDTKNRQTIKKFVKK